MEMAEITDLYQASYYLINGAEIMGVECIPTGKSTNCRILVQGTNLTDLAQRWFEKEAVANLWAFRNAYSQINSHVQQAKRSYELAHRPSARGRI